MNSEKKTDKRVLYTKRAIRESFLKLLDEKPIEKISVTEICQLAGINRGTFYTHYSDAYDLRDSIEEEMAEIIRESFSDLKVNGHLLSPTATFEVVRQNREIFSILSSPYCNTRMLSDFIRQYVDHYIGEHAALIGELGTEKLELLKCMVTAAVGAAVKCWFDSDMESEPGYMANAIETLCMRGLMGFLEDGL